VPIQVPIITIIDYRGFRLVAMPVLPLLNSSRSTAAATTTTSTLVYGSQDGGATVLNSDTKFSSWIESAAKAYNLAAHRVRDVTLYTGGDVEGHRVSGSTNSSSSSSMSKDKKCQDDNHGRKKVTKKEKQADDNANERESASTKYYLLDLARWAPPESPLDTSHLPSTNDGSSIFFRMLRPEFLKRCQNEEHVLLLPPLSSDTFSGWGRWQDKSHQRNLEIATHCLCTRIVKEVAQILVDEADIFREEALPPPNSTDISIIKFPDTIDVAGIAHQRGLPVRHLGLVWRQYFTCRKAYAASGGKYHSAVVSRILAEMISRSIKHMLRTRVLRAAYTTAELPLALSSFLTSLISKHKDGTIREYEGRMEEGKDGKDGKETSLPTENREQNLTPENTNNFFDDLKQDIFMNFGVSKFFLRSHEWRDLVHQKSRIRAGLLKLTNSQALKAIERLPIPEHMTISERVNEILHHIDISCVNCKVNNPGKYRWNRFRLDSASRNVLSSWNKLDRKEQDSINFAISRPPPPPPPCDDDDKASNSSRHHLNKKRLARREDMIEEIAKIFDHKEVLLRSSQYEHNNREEVLVAVDDYRPTKRWSSNQGRSELRQVLWRCHLERFENDHDIMSWATMFSITPGCSAFHSFIDREEQRRDSDGDLQQHMRKHFPYVLSTVFSATGIELPTPLYLRLCTWSKSNIPPAPVQLKELNGENGCLLQLPLRCKHMNLMLIAALKYHMRKAGRMLSKDIIVSSIRTGTNQSSLKSGSDGKYNKRNSYHYYGDLPSADTKGEGQPPSSSSSSSFFFCHSLLYKIVQDDVKPALNILERLVRSGGLGLEIPVAAASYIKHTLETIRDLGEEQQQLQDQYDEEAEEDDDHDDDDLSSSDLGLKKQQLSTQRRQVGEQNEEEEVEATQMQNINIANCSFASGHRKDDSSFAKYQCTVDVTYLYLRSSVLTPSPHSPLEIKNTRTRYHYLCSLDEKRSSLPKLRQPLAAPLFSSSSSSSSSSMYRSITKFMKVLIDSVTISLRRHLRYLNLSDKCIHVLPETFLSSSDHDDMLSTSPLLSSSSSSSSYYSSALTELILDRNDLVSLPSMMLQNLLNLSSLSIESNNLRYIPREIGNLKLLIKLNVKKNKLISLPDELATLNNLRVLDVSYNNLGSVPCGFVDLSNVHHFNMSHNQISELPAGVQNHLLINIIDFHLSGNPLCKLPSLPRKSCMTVRKYDNRQDWLQHLQILETEKCGLKNIPEEWICDIKSLKILNLSQNSIASLPKNFGEGNSQLRILNLSDNVLEAIPHKIEGLLSLIELNVGMNQLKSIPSTISKLVGLKIVNISCNKLSSLPAEIGTLTELQELSLSHNSIKSLPPSIGQLRALRKLNLGTNQLESLPTEIGCLHKIEKLLAHDNCMVSLPESLPNLQMLRVLYASNNLISKLDDGIGGLKALEELYLNKNKLISLPETIGQLLTLHTIQLSENQLVSLPSSFAKLKKVSSVDFRQNKLRSIPEEMANMSFWCPSRQFVLHENLFQTLPKKLWDKIKAHRKGPLRGIQTELGAYIKQTQNS